MPQSLWDFPDPEENCKVWTKFSFAERSLTLILISIEHFRGQSFRDWRLIRREPYTIASHFIFIFSYSYGAHRLIDGGSSDVFIDMHVRYLKEAFNNVTASSYYTF
jgi:hypothetical protein